MKSKTKLLSLASIAALGLVSCANDELKEVYAGEDISFTTRVTRATPTTLDNLDGFRVYADADGYRNLFINGLKAVKKAPGSGDYVLESKITWPVDVNKIRFWAYGPLDANITPEISAQTQLLKSCTVAPNMTDGGVNHQDIVVTYTEATRESTSGMQVPLEFHHALSQVEVKIRKGEGFEEGRVVKVKGAWIINVHSEGDLEFDLTAANHHMNWATSVPANYGRILGDGTRLGNNVVNMISNEAIGGGNSSLMVLPQKFVKYQFEDAVAAADNALTNAPNYNSSGTYILVLCRVETEHKFDATPEGASENPAIGPLVENGVQVGHVHQLFPVVEDADGHLVFDADAYGYSCVPIEGEWLPGKKYVYTLEFCGKNSGAGVYPPEPLPDGLPEGEKRPDDKKPGDPVLDDPITFSVTVSDWTEENVNTPMN